MIGDLISLTKPRLVLGNMLVPMAAFIFGSGASVDWGAFWFMTTGLWLIMGSGCALNNYFDRGIDARMERTKNRALPAGRVAPGSALILGLLLLAAAVALLQQTTLHALWAALVGWVFYALLYTPIKHVSGYSLFVGAVSGAMPPVVGYAAATGRFDEWALLFFILMYLWQLPHFVAIALFRWDEYRAAGVPLLVPRPTHADTPQKARKAFSFSLALLLLWCVILLAAHAIAAP